MIDAEKVKHQTINPNHLLKTVFINGNIVSKPPNWGDLVNKTALTPVEVSYAVSLAVKQMAISIDFFQSMVDHSKIELRLIQASLGTRWDIDHNLTQEAFKTLLNQYHCKEVTEEDVKTEIGKSIMQTVAAKNKHIMKELGNMVMGKKDLESLLENLRKGNGIQRGGFMMDY